MDCSTSATTIRPHNFHLPDLSTPASTSLSLPSSPRSSALPSPPDSPSSDSISSFPSVSSSFFFSSAAASPGHLQPQSSDHHARDSTQGLIIPSLTLPAALRRPTPYGQTLGSLRLLVLGSEGAGKSFLTGLLLEDNEDVVEVGAWEDAEYGKVLRASTDWVEHRDAYGLEKFEPTRNVEIVELPGYDQSVDVNELSKTIKSIIQSPFYTVSDVLDPRHRPSAVAAALLSSSCSPLYTALIFLLPSTPTPIDHRIIDNLGTQIPIIMLPRLAPHNHNRHPSTPKLSSFRPATAIALRTGLFHSPETLSALRSEATDRFLRWREVERTVDEIHTARRAHEAEYASLQNHRGSDGLLWDKAKWEAEWEAGLSQDVARRLRDGTLTEQNLRYSADDYYECEEGQEGGHGRVAFDPLHLPSLIVFSLSLLGPLQHRLGKSLRMAMEAVGRSEVRVAFVAGLCVGLGAKYLLK